VPGSSLQKLLALAALLVCTAWLAREPGWRSGAAALGALVALVGLEVASRRTSGEGAVPKDKRKPLSQRHVEIATYEQEGAALDILAEIVLDEESEV
jgi:hypothetical protein